jgi:lysophospholipase L1-like esterase
MKAALFVFGLLAAFSGGVAVLFTLGEVPALVVALALVGAAVAGFFVGRPVVRGLLIGVLVVFLASAAFVTIGLARLVDALTTTEGAVDPPDPVALASADGKVDEIRDAVAFRFELTEAEMTAYMLDGLQGVEDNPLQSVTLDVVDGEDGGPGRLEFEAEFKSGGVGASGWITVALQRGAVQVELGDVSVGSFDLPGLAQTSLEDLVERVADFNETLATAHADVQSIVLAADRLVITGTQTSTDLLTSGAVLSGLQEAAASAVGATSPPPERLGPGTVDATSAAGSPVYVALGDSLAANVGVANARDGYVSRFHNQLELRDGADYGLRNFGVSGETTGTLIRGGQLDAAVAFMEDNAVAYVTVDIGANNLLGHLGSDACSESLDDPDCQSRLEATFDSYGPDMEVILGEIREAAPDATILFLTAYNPFSLGLGTALEGATDAALADFNAIASAVATDVGVLVADGFEPMRLTTAATTHMLDAAPDIHPVAIGFDILAGALLDALS